MAQVFFELEYEKELHKSFSRITKTIHSRIFFIFPLYEIHNNFSYFSDIDSILILNVLPELYASTFET